MTRGAQVAPNGRRGGKHGRISALQCSDAASCARGSRCGALQRLACLQACNSSPRRRGAAPLSTFARERVCTRVLAPLLPVVAFLRLSGGCVAAGASQLLDRRLATSELQDRAPGSSAQRLSFTKQPFSTLSEALGARRLSMAPKKAAAREKVCSWSGTSAAPVLLAGLRTPQTLLWIASLSVPSATLPSRPAFLGSLAVAASGQHDDRTPAAPPLATQFAHLCQCVRFGALKALEAPTRRSAPHSRRSKLTAHRAISQHRAPCNDRQRLILR